MPIRFSTEAANADVLGEDPTPGSATQDTPSAVGADGTARDRADRSHARDSRPLKRESGEAKPGKDINAAGFVKDRDASKP
jgi:hypothetical protein